MKIGIVTQPLETNYGGLLQNYALQQILIKLGYNPITLDHFDRYQSDKSLVSGFKIDIKNLLKTLFYGERYITYRKYHKLQKKIRVETDKFIAKEIYSTSKFKDSIAIKKYIEKNNIKNLIVGSDQVWRPLYNENIFMQFLDFAEENVVHRIAYAASFGVDDWEFTAKETAKCRKLIKKFNSISVRESSGVCLCEEYLKVKAVEVIDPTMLLDKIDYCNLIDNEEDDSEYLFVYILDSSFEKQNFVYDISNKLKLKIYKGNPIPLEFCKSPKDISKCIYPSVSHWLSGVKNAKYVICDSFHGAVFSIIFNKPFVVLGNKERGNARFDSLLTLFDLKDRLASVDEAYTTLIKPIDWAKVNRIKNERKIFSINFLKKSMEL